MKWILMKLLRFFWDPPPVSKRLRYISEDNSWQNIADDTVIEVVIRDHAGGVDHEVDVGPGESLKLPEGMELCFARYKPD